MVRALSNCAHLYDHLARDVSAEVGRWACVDADADDEPCVDATGGTSKGAGGLQGGVVCRDCANSSRNLASSSSNEYFVTRDSLLVRLRRVNEFMLSHVT